MSRVDAVAALDRLPWLSDEPQALPPTRIDRGLVGWAVAGIAVFAGAGFWMGTNSVDERLPPEVQRATTTVRLPEPRPAASGLPEVQLSRVPEVEPILAPPIAVIDEPQAASRATDEPAAAPRLGKAVVGVDQAPKPWPVRQLKGAAGRLVRIGAFSTVHQAKRGWWAIVRSDPALERLPALVVPARSLRNRRASYRLQMGTTSRAHSAALCQRMRTIAQSCSVIGLGKSAGSAR